MSNTGRSTDTWYEAAVPVSVRAGRDIMRLDVTALHNNARDLSLIEAGRDIIYANAQVAGPGTLLMQAARQVRQDDAASVRAWAPSCAATTGLARTSLCWPAWARRDRTTRACWRAIWIRPARWPPAKRWARIRIAWCGPTAAK